MINLIETTRKIQTINATYSFVISGGDSFVISGGGTQAISEFLKYGGSSSFLEEVIIPYGMNSIHHLEREHPEIFRNYEINQQGFNTIELSECYANVALKNIINKDHFVHHKEYDGLDTGVNQLTTKVGVGVTASLTKGGEQEREGRVNSLHITVKNVAKTLRKTVVLNKQWLNTREEQEEWCAKQILESLIEFQENIPNQTQEYSSSRIKSVTYETLDEGYLDFDYVHIMPYNSYSSKPLHHSEIIFPGSYAPIHLGHITIFNKVSETYDFDRGLHDKISFELSTNNADKGTIKYKDLKNRIDEIYKQIPDAKILITNKSLFIDKARLFPNTKFVVGFDTISRIGNLKYYKTEEEMLACFAEFKKLGTKFILAHRNSTNEDIKILHPALSELIETVINTNISLSSTEIRNRNKNI